MVSMLSISYCRENGDFCNEGPFTLASAVEHAPVIFK